MSARASLATRVVYRCLLRAIPRNFCEGSQQQLQQIVREEFRCPDMAAASSLDDALAILRNLSASESARLPGSPKMAPQWSQGARFWKSDHQHMHVACQKKEREKSTS